MQIKARLILLSFVILPFIAMHSTDAAASDSCAVLVTVTDELAYIEDGWHYDTNGFLLLGTAFADAAQALKTDCRQ